MRKVSNPLGDMFRWPSVELGATDEKHVLSLDESEETLVQLFVELAHVFLTSSLASRASSPERRDRRIELLLLRPSRN